MIDQNTQAENSPLPVTILTGFLGAGKTTLLRHILQAPQFARSAVLINEFGAIGLDHHLVQKIDDQILLMDNGCICCTIQDNLVQSMRQLLRKRFADGASQFDRVIIETTGIADPAPILHSLMADAVLAHRYRLDGVVCCIDGLLGQDTLASQPEAAKQLAVADRIILTKADLIAEKADAAAYLAALEGAIHAINPRAPICHSHDGLVDPGMLFGLGLYDPATGRTDIDGWLQDSLHCSPDCHDADHHHHHDHGHHDHSHHHHADATPHSNPHGISSIAIRHDQPVTWDDLQEWVGALSASLGADLLRLKGIIWLDDEEAPVAIHGVQHMFHPPALLESWPDGRPENRIVVIARLHDPAPIQQMFTAFMTK